MRISDWSSDVCSSDLVVPEHGRDTELHALARDAVRALLESPTTQLVDVSTAVARKAGDLRVKHGLHTWDAVHLATAILAGVADRKSVVSGKRVSVRLDLGGLRIIKKKK